MRKGTKKIGDKPSEAGTQWIEEKDRVWWPSEEMKKKAHITDPVIYEEALEDPKKFWAKMAKKYIDWFEPEWEITESWDPPYFKWFKGAKVNLCYNAVDRHLEERADEPALVYESEPVEERGRILTYKDLHQEVCRFANVLADLGIEKGEPVTLWMPMIPETMVALLACQRISAPHSVVYTAFSPSAVQDRMKDAGSKSLITSDGFYRRGKEIRLKERIDPVLKDIGAENCIVVPNIGMETPMEKGRDYLWPDLMEEAAEEFEPVPLDAEYMSFLLYTSGTTGKPKGVQHSVGGYLVQVAATMHWVFDFYPEDIFFSTADIGWITGHSYTCYGPLLLGGTTLWYDGAPDYPEPDRLWQIVEEYCPTILYTAPTVLRMLKRKGDEWPEKHDLSSLRLLGTVGEPIDEETWMWFFEKIGGGRCPIVDTYWQTETGGITVSSLPGIGPFIPGVAGMPLPGMKYDVLDSEGLPTEKGESGRVVSRHPFAPGFLRGLYGKPDEYIEEYWKEYGIRVYFSGDGGVKTEHEIAGQPLIRFTGRIDDVMEIAGHRIGTAEIEDVVTGLPEVAEAALAPMPDEIKGELPAVFAVCKENVEPTIELKKKVVKQVREKIGPIATPGEIFFVDDLPKTESGKVIRRILRRMLAYEELGDMTTAKNPECLKDIAEKVGYKGPQKIPGYK